MRFRQAFSMLELIFVIVIMGIIGKFGVEFLAQSYKSFIFTNINNTLESHSATAVEFISTRLQYRIKDSIIAKDSSSGNFLSLASASTNTYNVLEWIGNDIDGFRGNSNGATNLPNWSGVIDLDLSSSTALVSPSTDTTKIDSLISTLSYGDSDANDAALYFIGSSSDIVNGYGWSGAITDQNQTLHPINTATTFSSVIGNFSEIYEYYKLVWTAYAVVHNTTSSGDLTLYSDYQPWKGEAYTQANEINLLMQNVDTFQFMAIGSIVKIQVCVNSSIVEDYSLCKEKTIY